MPRLSIRLFPDMKEGDAEGEGAEPHLPETGSGHLFAQGFWAWKGVHRVWKIAVCPCPAGNDASENGEYVVEVETKEWAQEPMVYWG